MHISAGSQAGQCPVWALCHLLCSTASTFVARCCTPSLGSPTASSARSKSRWPSSWRTPKRKPREWWVGSPTAGVTVWGAGFLAGFARNLFAHSRWFSGSDLRHGPVYPGQIHGDGDLQGLPGLSLQHRGIQIQHQPHERQRQGPLKLFPGGETRCDLPKGCLILRIWTALKTPAELLEEEEAIVRLEPVNLIFNNAMGLTVCALVSVCVSVGSFYTSFKWFLLQVNLNKLKKLAYLSI